MKLPHAERAWIEPGKAPYLLRLDGKGPVFASALGFAAYNVPVFEAALLRHAQTGEVRSAVPSKDHNDSPAQKFVLWGLMKGANGRTVGVKTVWQLVDGDDRPRFITSVVD